MGTALGLREAKGEAGTPGAASEGGRQACLSRGEGWARSLLILKHVRRGLLSPSRSPNPVSGAWTRAQSPFTEPTGLRSGWEVQGGRWNPVLGAPTDRRDFPHLYFLLFSWAHSSTKASEPGGGLLRQLL